MMQNPKNTEETKMEAPEGKVSGYGGYSTRHEYEKKREGKSRVLAAVQILALAVLLVFSCLGVIALVQGEFLPEQEEGGAGAIKVPTKSELSENARSADEMMAELALSQITVEVEKEDGSFRYGTGFLVSDDGYAVCAASLVDQAGKSITASTGDGFSFSAEWMGSDEALGIALLHIKGDYLYTPTPVENSFFVERGEELYAVSTCKPKQFYGTVAKGIVSSVGPAVKAGGEEIYVNIIYLDIASNETLYGAPVVDETGAAVGFLTDAIPPLYGNLTPVVPINIVYTVINEILVQG